MKTATLLCVTTTPFGVPVEPDVKRMYAASPGAVPASSGVAGMARASDSENRPEDVADVSSQPTGTDAIPGWVSATAATKPCAADAASRQHGSTAASIAAARGAGLPRSIGT